MNARIAAGSGYFGHEHNDVFAYINLLALGFYI
jgi:hypothetical protein